MSLPKRLGWLAALVTIAASLAPFGSAQTFSREDVDFFETKIRPLLAEQCLSCHTSSRTAPPANLALDSRAAILHGGDSGPAAVPGKPAASRILQAVRYEGPQMPPAGKLPSDQIALLEQWISKGLPWPQETTSAPPAPKPAALPTSRWVWEKLHSTPVPAVRNVAAAPTPPDRFLQAKLEAANLQPTPQADRRTLLRRVSVDLIGLAPTYAEVQSFENDRRPDAYARQVDRLLASPHFGERWARHWMDLARYADSGTLGIRFPLAVAYRDWVIDAFNRDLPYDRFVTLQLAADQVDLQGRQQDLAALGFIALGNDLYRATELPDRVDDRIDVVSRGLLSLTVSCARCHDHKYDPIPTRDYYSLYGVFANTQLLGFAKTIAPTANEGIASWYEPRIALRAKSLDDYRRDRLAVIRAEYAQPAESDKYRKAAEEARQIPAVRREGFAREHNLNAYMLERWVRSLNDHTDPLAVPLEDFGYVMTEGDSNTTRELRKEYEQMVSEFAWRGSKARVTSVADERNLRPAHVLVRGNLNDPGEETPPCFVSVLSGPNRPCFTRGSGRAELAGAILHGPFPIASRVMVNRVWQQLFGEGLIRSVSDFGKRGEEPTHPELLDYLASRYEMDGWSTKRLIRSLVLTSAYRRSSKASPEALAADPENRLLSHMNRRRMDFESMRDSMLLSAARLDSTMGGKPIALSTIPTDPRRTIYTYIERERPLPLLKVFDVADPEQHTPSRGMTVVPQQALFLMNSPFIQEISTSLEASLLKSSPDAAPGKAPDFATALFRATLQRDPAPDEKSIVARIATGTPSHAPTPAPHAANNSPWHYGTVSLDLAAARVRDFREFRYFTGAAWQTASMLPDAREGMALLTATGGSPGDGLQNAVSRRWVAPRDMTIRVTSALVQRRSQFAQRFNWTNGVRGSLLSSHAGMLGQWLLDGPVKGAKIVEQDESKAQADLPSLAVKAGEVLDFVVDSRDDPESDGFSWNIKIEEIGGTLTWDSARDFKGPETRPLTPRARAAMVLLMSNEFAFVD